MTDLAELRRNYARGSLDTTSVAADPIDQMRRWLDEAIAARVPEPNAFTLCTVDADGLPDGRVLLLKGLDADGFRFFTNFHSAKGRQLTANPRAALVFLWLELERQVRVQGTVSPLDPALSQAYFHSRPTGSQIGAIASNQSAVAADRSDLERRFATLEAQYPEGTVIPMPAHWGGYNLVPTCIEFWQGRPSRLHDRIRYRLDDGHWRIERLEP